MLSGPAWDLRVLEVCERDGYRCRICGGPGDDPHHLRWRSKGGGDELHNLLTVCRRCHDAIHDRRGPRVMWTNDDDRAGTLVIVRDPPRKEER